MPLEIRVLGPLEVLVDGTPAHVDTRKALAILALLAVEGRPYAREELAAMFWPEADDDGARGALRRTLSVLRAALGARWLVVDRSAVELPRAEDVEIDLVALDAAAGPDAVAPGSRGGSEAVAALARAAALARGPFLAGFSLRDSPDFDDWRATRAVSVERRVVAVLERLALGAETLGDARLAADAASRLVELDPLDEPARRRLMAILARAGDRTGAIRVYRATVAVLERELGVAPLAETTALYEAIRDDRLAVPERGPTVVGHPFAVPSMPLVGREPEMADLVALHAACRRDGRIAAIRGEAGIGKSRLAEALAARVIEEGAVALTARAYPTEGGIAWALVIGLLRAGLARDGAAAALGQLPAATLAEVARLIPLPAGIVPPATPPVADSPAARARLLEAVAAALSALAAGPAPGLLVAEDVHWADDASREALLFLGRRLAGRALLLVATWRDEDLDEAGLAFAAAWTAIPGCLELRLGRLGAGEIGRLVDAAAMHGAARWDVEVLAAESEGLPLYVVEAIAVGPSPGAEPPRGVRTLLRERLASVGETAAQVLAAGAVIGRSFDLDAVRAASGRSEEETADALEELVRRAIVRETGEVRPTYDFAHARLRDAAYLDIGLARRRILHRRVAEVLRAASPDDAATLALVARHEQAAGRDAAAAEAYREAGLRARGVVANREALEHLEAALALGHPSVVELQVAIGEVRTALGDYAGAIAALESAAALASGEVLPGIELRLGRVHARRDDAATAASHLDAALASLAEPGARATALVERGAVALGAGDLELATAMAAEADALAAASGDRQARGAAARLAGLVAWRRGDLDGAREALLRSEALAAASADDEPGPLIAARNALALVEAEAGDRERAITLLEAALAESGRAGEPHLEAAVENNLADQLHALGRADEAMAHLKRAVSLFAEVGGRPDELEPGVWRLVTW